jgi:hypothetical protein
MAQKSRFAGVSGARAQRASNYFAANSHVLVRVIKIEEGQDRFNVPLVAGQFQVIHNYGDTGNKVGEEVSEVLKSTNVAFAPRLKALAMAVGDLTEGDFDSQEFDGQIFEEMVSDDQPGGGVILEVRTTAVVKQAAKSKSPDMLVEGDTYTRTDFIRKVSFSETNEILTGGGLTADQINRMVPAIAQEIEAEGQA